MVDDPTPQEIRSLLRSIEDAGWDYARVKINDLTLVVASDPKLAEQETAASTPAAPPASAAPPVSAAPPAPTTATDRDTAQTDTETSTIAPAGSDEATALPAETITSPSIGLFWRSPKPGAPPYVEIGQTVTADDTVCIIEVMKLMTHVKAGSNGTVARIHAENGDMVEFGTPLVDITPA